MGSQWPDMSSLMHSLASVPRLCGGLDAQHLWVFSQDFCLFTLFLHSAFHLLKGLAYFGVWLWLFKFSVSSHWIEWSSGLS